MLDETTGQVDTANERRVLSALDRLRERMTVVVIARRVALVAAADRIVVLKLGWVAAAGIWSEVARELSALGIGSDDDVIAALWICVRTRRNRPPGSTDGEAGSAFADCRGASVRSSRARCRGAGRGTRHPQSASWDGWSRRPARVDDFVGPRYGRE